MRVSVALAAYNGEKYIREQIESIASQLRKDVDELIISYQNSTDNTLKILAEMRAKYKPLIKILQCKEEGLIANFDNAVRHCSKEIIFLADQDDVWYPDKVEKVMQAFEEDHSILVIHNCAYTDADLNRTGKDLFKDRHVKKGTFRNWFKNGYQGSCMAFRRELLGVISPIPRDLLMHDQWIGLIAEKCGNISYLPEVLMDYRRHAGVNSSDKGISLPKKMNGMYHMMAAVTGRLSTELNRVRFLEAKFQPKPKKQKDKKPVETPVITEPTATSEANNGETMMYMVNDLQEEKRDKEE